MVLAGIGSGVTSSLLMGRLDAHRLPASPSVATPPSSGSPARRDRIAELRERDDRKIQSHRSDRKDEPWATNAASLLRSDLEAAMAGAAFRIVDVDCRTTSCTAELAWPRAVDAFKDYESIVRRSYMLNCARGVSLPEARNEGPMQATLIFDCAKWKDAGSRPFQPR